ncbi:class I SAM-dependent methyltransferase [Bergeriella denitrificans]|uniref:Uncharacterized ACR, COG1565 n=1 Tax=Bergeriella denitrificans TaxID=494 RepID=A0A378UKC1_BERDE|nr:class I SAM-dependent methyltransferase [Bergeriella denitrificans]STZ76931.1 Uncharacterized ACR, COG1565 [Bergeriella denitrificans]
MKPHIPAPEAEAQAASARLVRLIADEITRCANWLPFSRFMELALYAPGCGYYTGGAHKIGAAGDFITAPTLTHLFGQTVARQLAPLLPQTGGTIYEFGAGTGDLAAVLLNSLGPHIQRYCIIEVSPELAERQRSLIAAKVPSELAQKVAHLPALPDTLDGIVVGNEVLDAMPVELISRRDGAFLQQGVSLQNDTLIQTGQTLTQPDLLEAAARYFPAAEPYTSELHPAQYAFVRTLADRLVRGAVLLIDYGFDAAQYYHPQRHMGTLIGHYRHHTVHDPFFHIGLTDLTAHVNFTDTAQAAVDGGLDLIGYTTQANFLLNLGITELLAQSGRPDSAAYAREAAAVQQLLNPHEMGELFKVIAFGRGIDVDWQGFAFGDICHKL